MKNIFTRIFLFTLLVLVAGAFTSCKHKGFKKADEGYYYKFYVQNEDSLPVQDGDLVLIMHTLRTVDSVIMSDYPMQLLIREPLFEGDLYTALCTMHKGDSATFIMNIDSFAYYYFHDDNFMPELKEREIYLDIKVEELMPAAEFEKMRAEQEAAYNAEMERLRLAEDSILNDYIMKNKIKAVPTESGLIYIKKKSGTGVKAENGKLVSVHYTGKFLDGEVFDSSEGKEPIQIVLGKGSVIPGWEEGIALMREGEKGLLILPSKIAYAERGAGNVIPPYTPIMFDVELIKVEDAPAEAPAAMPDGAEMAE